MAQTRFGVTVFYCTTPMSNPPLAHAPLGHEVAYPTAYDPSLLFPVDRTLNRRHLTLPEKWFGSDIWNGYELSWLNAKGKPVVALGRFEFPHTSPFLVESKSLKLYLNSYNEEKFESTDLVAARMAADLGKAAGATVKVELQVLDGNQNCAVGPLQGSRIDDLDITIDRYEPAPEVLKCLPDAATVSETLVSDLLKSNCPVTGQPDWGSVQVSYSGPQIDPASLLRYVVSLRRHTEFHEHCVEKMFCDIQHACNPTSLRVYARYTRRGGLDINPWRSTEPLAPDELRNPRQ
jgi:7-cyano-7-deazaguanine reductase